MITASLFSPGGTVSLEEMQEKKGVKYCIKNDAIHYIINGTYRVKRIKEDKRRVFTYKIQKTQILATDGSEGLVSFIEEWHGEMFFSALKNSIQKYEQ